MKRIILVLTMVVGWTMAADGQTGRGWRDSLQLLNGLIRLYPDSMDLRLKKAAVNIELDQWEYAVEEYGRVLERSPLNLSALYYRAYAYNHLRRYDLARLDYERFLSVMPRHFEAQLGLAMTKRKLMKENEALDDLNRLVEMFPDSAVAYASRAALEGERRAWTLALYDWDEALARWPENLDFALSKADVLIALKRRKEARRLLRELIERGAPLEEVKPYLERCK